MKRLRDEVYSNPQFKRPFGAASSSRGEPPRAPEGGGGAGSSNGGTAAASGSAQKLTTNDALTYLKEVKDMFQDKREKYDRFLDVMKDFKAQRVDTTGVIGRVKELFRGHPNLILGFNTFLPKGYEITLTEEEAAIETPPKKTVQFGEAIQFVNKIKERFTDENNYVYKSFLEILNMYRKEHKGISEVYQEVSSLFENQPDLLQEFTKFLPDTSGSASEQHEQQDSFQRYDERSSSIPTMRQTQTDKQRPYRDRIMGPHEERGENPDVDDDKTEMKLHKKHIEKENRRNRDQDEREIKNENNGDKKKSSRKAGDLAGSSSMATYDKDALKSMYSHEFTFCEKVKERLGSDDDYQAFLKCLHIYSTEIITRKELQSLVADLLGKYPDLMEGFNEFLEHSEQIDGFLADMMGKKSIWNEGHSSKPLRIDDKDKEHKREVEAAKEKERHNKYFGKSIQELDLSNCQRCTPSYRLLPDDYPIPAASQRSELGAQVLNDHWVSVTSGSEDYSFKHMRRNQYEESLFRCEDDRFELDMLMESVISTAKRAEELLNNIDSNSVVGPIRLETHFTSLHLRCIERLYGDHGLDVVEVLRKNAPMALPVILTRLKQKLEEWTRARADFNKVWADIYAKNHYKSLDHRSFYFKQQDSKDLSAKSLVAEIKEIKEKTQTENDVLLMIAAGSRYSISPNLEFEYSDIDIHEDIYKIIKYSCEEICTTKEQVNKVLRLWTTFFESMMGLEARPYGSEATENDGQKTLKNTTMESKAITNGDSKEVNNSAIAVTVGSEANHGRGGISLRANNGPSEEGNGGKPTEGGETSKPDQLANTDLSKSFKTAGFKEDTVNPIKTEKEEGELSPVGDFEDCFGANKDVENEEIPENDDEEDSESISETGEDVSGSDSAAEECSQEEEVEEEGEQDVKVESEGEVDVNTSEGGDNGASVLVSESFLMNCKPVSKHISYELVSDEKKDKRVFYGNDPFYVLFRLHQALYERILSAKTSLESDESKWRVSKDASSDPYARFMSALFSLLDGSFDNNKFEDECRSLIGNQSYVLFTLDKLIYKLVRQLQTVSSDELACKLLQLCEYEKCRSPEKYVDSVYYDNVHILLHDENIYRIDCASSPTRLSIQLMDEASEKSEMVSVSVDPNFATYLQNDYLSVDHGKKETSKIALKRNMRKYGNVDESDSLFNATENVLIMNGLECKMATSSSKISYVLDTEDYFIRIGRKRVNASPKKSSTGQASVQRFHKFLSAAI